MASRQEELPRSELLHGALSVLSGGAVGLVVCLLSLLGGAWAVSSGAVGEEMAGRVVALCCVLGGLCGGLTAILRCRRRAILVGAAAGAALFLLILLAGRLGFQASPLKNGGLWLFLSCILGGTLSGFPGLKLQSRRKYHRSGKTGKRDYR